MIRNAFLTLAVYLVVATSVAQAFTTIQFFEPYFGGIANNLANAANVATNGMRWGIVVDTTGNGFAGGGASYDGFVSSATTNGFWGFGGVTSDDYFISGALTVNGALTLGGEPLFPGADDGTTPGDGTIADDIVVSYVSGIGLNDKFALVWFDTNSTAVGAKYGFFSDPSFLLPSDSGASVSFGSPFLGSDPIRAASNTFAGVAVIPEPSRAFLLLGGMLGLAMRRRRA